MNSPFIKPFQGVSMVQNRNWLHPWKVAQYLSCTKRHVYELVAQGQLEAIKLGPRALRISEVSLNGFIDKMKVKNTENI
jgi:excisionase family DNA binding protein